MSLASVSDGNLDAPDFDLSEVATSKCNYVVNYESVNKAADVLRNAIVGNKDLRTSFVATVKSALDDSQVDLGCVNKLQLAVAIVDRLVGDDIDINND